MKGTAISVLIMGETANQHKADIMHSIKLDKEIISTFTKHNSDGAFTEAITILRANIKGYMAEMIQLERWRRQEGIGKDEPFKPKSLRDKLAKMTEEEREEYGLQQAQKLAEIADLEYQLWEKQNIPEGGKNAEG